MKLVKCQDVVNVFRRLFGRRPKTGDADCPKKRVTPSAALVRIFLAGLVCWFILGWLFSIRLVSGGRWRGEPPFEAYAELRSIRNRLHHGGADTMNMVFPEGRLFSYSFYGLALVNMATALPEDHPFRAHAVSEIEWILPIVEAEVDAPQFRFAQSVVPRGGIIPAGHANLLRGGYALLGGKNHNILTDFHEASASLSAAFAASQVASLETFSYAIWPVDNCFALESLRLHDVLYRTDYSAACRRWESWMAEHRDDDSGMMIAQVLPQGFVADGPRGCALSWSLAMMPSFAPELAQSQYGIYRSNWFTHIWGMTGIDEWPPGENHVMDVDSGPVFWHVGAAASGFGIAAAKANGDWASLGRMLRGLELLGMSTWGWNGKQYFFGALLLADEIALWGKTIRKWDSPRNAELATNWPAQSGSRQFLLVMLILALPLFFIVRAAIRSATRAWRQARANSEKWRRSSMLAFSMGMLALLGWFFIPAIKWYHVIILLGIIDSLESRLAAMSQRRGVATLLALLLGTTMLIQLHPIGMVGLRLFTLSGLAVLWGGTN